MMYSFWELYTESEENAEGDTMLVRKCDAETARELSKKDKQKLLAIITLDSIEEPDLIRRALKLITELAHQQRRS